MIVSEETGAISMAVGGKIDRDLTAEQLRERLGNELRRYMAPVALPTVVMQNRGIGRSFAGGRTNRRRW